MFLLSSILESNRPRLPASRIPDLIANVLSTAGFIPVSLVSTQSHLDREEAYYYPPLVLI